MTAFMGYSSAKNGLNGLFCLTICFHLCYGTLMGNTRRKKEVAQSVESNIEFRTKKTAGSRRIDEVMTLARQTGLFSSGRTEFIRGCMPKALIDKARANSGVKSDTELLEVALAALAVADDYPDWLLSRRGTISKDIDLEF